MFLCLFVRINFWQSKSVARNCAQRMRPQTMGSNTLSGSIIIMSFRPVSCRPFAIFYLYVIFLTLEIITTTIIINSVGVQHCDAFYPHWGPEESGGVQTIVCVFPSFCLSLSLYLCISVSMSICLAVHVTFWLSKRTDRNCACNMQECP